MPRWLRILLAILTGIILLFLLAWLGIAAYVRINREKVLKEITQQVNENIQGTVSIRNMDTELLRGFPGISVSLAGVTVRDSLWQTHRRDLLQVQHVYISLNILSLLKKQTSIREVEISDGTVYLHTDTLGYSNRDIFRRKDGDKKHTPHIGLLKLHHVMFVFEHEQKFKLFRLDIKSLVSKVTYLPDGWKMNAGMDMMVRDFTFNTRRGSFLKNKRLHGSLDISYSSVTHVMHIPVQQLLIDNDKIKTGGDFMLGQKPATFTLRISSDKIDFDHAASLTPPNISAKLKLIGLERPLSLDAYIQGRIKYRDTPRVQLHWLVKDNVLTTPAGEIRDCSFEGNFINEYAAGKGHNDHNSSLALSYITGSWQDIRFKGKNLKAVDLINPYVSGGVSTHFDISKLNGIIGTRTFRFGDGQADADIYYEGYVTEAATTAPYIKGKVNIHAADITYVPRNLSFRNSSVSMSFAGSDLLLNDAALYAGRSSLHIKGTAKNFLNLYYSDPDKIVMDWRVTSPRIDLDEFLSFAGRRKSAASVKRSPYARIEHISEKIDDALDKGSVHMLLDVDNLNYRKFTAAGLSADVLLEHTSILLKDVRLNNSGGLLVLNAQIDQNKDVNLFKLSANAGQIKVKDFFYAFENFGQDAITAGNIRGILNADVKVAGRMRQDGKIVPASLYGTVNAKLNDGALVDFAPFEKMSKIIFRNRDMSDVSFGELKTKLDISGNLIHLAPTHIEASAFTANVGGVYSLTTGTELNIDVSLRDPKKDELVVNDSLRARRSMKGIILHLKAVDGDDGNVKIKLTGVGL